MACGSARAQPPVRACSKRIFISSFSLPFGFAHKDSWLDIIWRLCEDLEPLVAEVEMRTGRPLEVLRCGSIGLDEMAAKLKSNHTLQLCSGTGFRGQWSSVTLSSVRLRTDALEGTPLALNGMPLAANAGLRSVPGEGGLTSVSA
jgi:hypothetical protein